MEGDLAHILAVVGFFILLYASVSYGGQIFGKLTGTQDSVFIGAAGCTGLTGATLTACQKAQPKPKPKPKPKPQGITAAPKKGITPAKPKPKPTGITPANPNPNRTVGTGGGVGGPTRKAFECKQRGGTWKCYTTGCICRMPITAPSPAVLALNACIKRVELYAERQKKFALDRLATTQYHYRGLNPGQQLLDNNTGSGGYQAKLLVLKYNNLKTDLRHQCDKKYLGLDIIADQNRGDVPRFSGDPKAGGSVAPGFKAGEYPV